VKAVFTQRADLQTEIDFGKGTNRGGHGCTLIMINECSLAARDVPSNRKEATCPAELG
jgi:hypothetical protein